jgi:hypothetical protein
MSDLELLLTQSADQRQPRPGLTGRVMSRLAAGQLRRRLGWAAVLAAALAVPLALQAHLSLVLGLMVQHWTVVSQQGSLLGRALAEALPWPVVLALAGLVVVRWRLAGDASRQLSWQRVRLTSGVAFAAVAGAAGLAYAATPPAPGPAQQQLRLIVNGIGKPELKLGNQTFQFDAGTHLSDGQLQAFAEYQRVVQLMKQVAAERGLAEASVGLAQAEVVKVESGLLTYKAGHDPLVGRLTGQTVYAQAGQRGGRFNLQPGDRIVIGTSLQGEVLVVAKLARPAADYQFVAGFTTAPLAHTGSGQCYGNPADRCPDLPAAYALVDLTNLAQPPASAALIETYGTITALDPTTVRFVTSSGRQWTLNAGAVIAAANRLGLQIGPGDHLRLEVWLPSGTAGFALTDPTLEPHPPGEAPFDPAHHPTVRLLQLALKQPWHYGQAPEKY